MHRENPDKIRNPLLAAVCQPEVKGYEDMNRFSSVNRRLQFKNHSPTDALIVKQSASWPYLSDSPDLEVRACPYVQMRVDIYTRPLTNLADFSLDQEIYKKEAWQNQLRVQRVISLLNYCIENASGVRKTCLNFLECSTMRSRKWMKISGYGKLTEIVVRGLDPGATGVSANVRWTLCCKSWMT